MLSGDENFANSLLSHSNQKLQQLDLHFKADFQKFQHKLLQVDKSL